MRKGYVIRDEWGEIVNYMDDISPVYKLTSLCDCLVGFV